MVDGALLSQMRIDNQNILNSGGFQTDITFISRNASKISVISGTATLHNTQLDPETGTFVNIRTAHIVVNQNDLISDGFPVYSGKLANEIYLKDVKISFFDANGILHEFVATDVRPSYTFGCISIMLGKTNA